MLLLAQGLAKLLALHEVLAGNLESALCNAQTLCGNANAAAVQGLHGKGEALAGGGNHVGSRHAAIGEKQLRHLRGANAHLIFNVANGEAGHPLFQHKRGHALGAQRRVGQRVNDKIIGERAVGNKALGAV